MAPRTRRLIAALFALACATSTPGWRAELQAWQWGEPVPAVPLVDQDGAAFDLGRYRDGWLLLTFVYAHCPDPAMCPTTLRRLIEVQEAWRASPRSVELGMLAVSLDPARDDPAALSELGRGVGADPSILTLATGQQGVVDVQLPSLFNVYAVPDGAGRLQHPVKYVLLKPGLRFDRQWTDADVSPAAVIAAVLGDAAR